MRIAGTIIGIILILVGGVWIAQGANMLAGSVMSGQSQWVWVGAVLAILGVVALWWTYRRRK
jgi:Na+/melibiose symporter-like transporter